MSTLDEKNGSARKNTVHHKPFTRPFRLWDSKAKKALPYRCYKIERNANIGALIEARYAEIGTTIEVLDVTTNKMIGQYTRRVNTVTFLKG